MGERFRFGWIIVWSLALIGTLPTPASAGDYQVGWVIRDLATGEVSRSDDRLARRKLAPCSTFKIYNTLIGLELGLISGADEPWYRWDGVRRWSEDWNRDLSLREAFRGSAVPAYQELARRIGLERMRDWVDRLEYGDRDLSAGVDVFWLPGEKRRTLMISAEEQVEALSRLLAGQTAFNPKHIQILRSVMKVDETPKAILYGKTGSGTDADGRWTLGWFVGFVESAGAVHVFACNVTDGDNPMGKTARSLIEEILRSQGLL